MGNTLTVSCAECCKSDKNDNLANRSTISSLPSERVSHYESYVAKRLDYKEVLDIFGQEESEWITLVDSLGMSL